MALRPSTARSWPRRKLQVSNSRTTVAGPHPDAAARARAAEQGISYEDYRRFRVPEWEGPFMIRDGDHIARLVEQEAPSPNHGVCMCAGMGMNGTDVLEAVNRFQGKIFFAQPRDLKGTWPQVEEVMPGEGDIDVKEFLRRLHAGGYTGLVNPEHFEDTKRPSADSEADAIAIIQDWINEVTGHYGLRACACPSAEERRSEPRRNSGRQR